MIYLDCKTLVPLSSSSYTNNYSSEDVATFSDTSGSVFSDNDDDDEEEDDDESLSYARDNFLA